ALAPLTYNLGIFKNVPQIDVSGRIVWIVHATLIAPAKQRNTQAENDVIKAARRPARFGQMNLLKRR
ncbi:hypothetical protein, partial [Sphingobium indicum]|uniref:hypothetical protein n=1 Tax=Sphingobium indicum TaxID=332055 RepID=UPI00056233A4